MANIQLSNIPGLQEAIRPALEREEGLRLKGFLGMPEIICGIECKLFTPRHLLLLTAAENPLIVGGFVGGDALINFLWIVSTEFQLGPIPKSFFEKVGLLTVQFEELLAAVRLYLEESLFDRLPTSGEESSALPTISNIGWTVDEIAGAYGWDDDQILDKPFLRLNQYLRGIYRRRYPSMKLGNAFSGRARREYIEAYVERQARLAKRREARARQKAKGGN